MAIITAGATRGWQKYTKKARRQGSQQKLDGQINANAMRTQCEEDANGMLPITHNLLPKNNNSRESKIPPCPHEKIIDLYHEILPELQSVNKKMWNDSKRAKDLTARWKQNEEFRKSQFWKWYFKSLRSSAFHMGDNNRGWKADLGWLLKKENFIKLVEQFND